MKIQNRFCLLCQLPILILLTLAPVVWAQGFAWTRQINGSAPAEETMNAVDFDGNLYVVGTTSGTLPGQTNAGRGGQDVFVRKYDANGIEIWTRQFGTSFEDWARGIEVDATGIYVTGITYGTFSGQTFAGYIDAFVRKYDTNGNAVWTRQFGTPSHDQPFGIATDGTGIYVVGGTGGDLPGYTNAGATDAFVRKYDVNGNEIWTRQIGTSSHEYAYSVFANATGVFLAGTTDGTLSGQINTGGGDAFVRQYDANGTEIWTRQFGTPARDEAWAISGDANGLYIAGKTEGFFPGQLNTGSNGAFVRKYDLNGNEGWTRQFGTLLAYWPPLEWATGISVDATGIYVAGTMSKSPLGPGGTPDFDAYVRKYDVSGNEVWTRLFGTLATDFAFGVSSGPTGVYVVGETNGTLPGQSRISAGDERDAFVRKYDVNGNEAWTHQIGTLGPSYEQATAVDANGGIYVAGYIHGALSAQASAGLYDAFVRKYDASGTEIWTRQFGSPEYDQAFGIAADASGVYVTGTTQGTLPGQSSTGGADVFVRKYDANGTESWTRQFGTPSFDQVSGISVDATGIYVAGSVSDALPGQTAVGATDAFVRKYDANGTELWTRQFGTPSFDQTSGISADVTGIYVAGRTPGTLPGQTNSGSGDVFVRKYDANGNEIWTRQFGTSSFDNARGISADATGIYIAGETNGIFPGQTSGQIFVRKYDVNGTEAWTRQFGASYFESANGIAVNATGVYVTGFTLGALPGQVNSGGTDPFVRKYDTNGNEIWTRQFGTWFDELANGVAVDATGIYVVGWTPGTLTSPSYSGSGNMDAFVVKLSSSPSSPQDDILALIAIVESLFDGGLENSLTAKLTNAIKSLEMGNTATAINQLQSFINQVQAQRGKAISESDADMLIAQAQAIIDALNAASAPKVSFGAAEIVNLPNSYELEQNYPNPFNPTTTIQFSVLEAGKVSAEVYSITGQLIRELVNGETTAGRHTVAWDGRNQAGEVVAAGMYLYKLVVHGANGEIAFSQTRRMAFVK